jgi:hypothetical protein
MDLTHELVMKLPADSTLKKKDSFIPYHDVNRAMIRLALAATSDCLSSTQARATSINLSFIGSIASKSRLSSIVDLSEKASMMERPARRTLQNFLSFSVNDDVVISSSDTSILDKTRTLAFLTRDAEQSADASLIVQAD